MKQFRVVGIDGSATSTGVAVLSAQEAGQKTDMCWSTQAIQIPGFSGLERAVRQVTQLDDILESTQPQLAVFENYAFKNKFTLATLVEVGTCLRLAVRRREIPYIEVSPTRLKKFIAVKTPRGSSQKVKKGLVGDAVAQQWRFTHDSDDVVDAYVLAQMGLLAAGRKEPAAWKTYQWAMRKDLTLTSAVS